jgi:hypothetical protein
LLKLKLLKAFLALATDVAGTGRFSRGKDDVFDCGAGEDLADCGERAATGRFNRGKDDVFDCGAGEDFADCRERAAVRDIFFVTNTSFSGSQ